MSAHGPTDAVAEIAAASHAPAALRDGRALEGLLTRRSVSPRRLGDPGPDADECRAILAAALRAPDHGALRPWRLIAFPRAVRPALADLFEAEKRGRDPLASPSDLARAREQALGPPHLLAFVVVPRPGHVPRVEQWLGAGAALGNLLNAAHLLGYGAIVLSGDRVFSPILRCGLQLDEGEHLAGFVSIGSIVRPPPPAPRPDADLHLSSWAAPNVGPHGVAAQARADPACDRRADADRHRRTPADRRGDVGGRRRRRTPEEVRGQGRRMRRS